MNSIDKLDQLHQAMPSQWGYMAAAVLAFAVLFHIVRFIRSLLKPSEVCPTEKAAKETPPCNLEPALPEPLIYRQKPLMRPTEQEFFTRLCHALPDLYVFPQVAFNALLDAPDGLTGYDKRTARNHFDRKIADYVVCCRQTFAVVAIIELDGQEHDPVKDKKRDDMLETAGYKTLRFKSRAKPSEQEIADRIATLRGVRNGHTNRM